MRLTNHTHRHTMNTIRIILGIAIPLSILGILITRLIFIVFFSHTFAKRPMNETGEVFEPIIFFARWKRLRLPTGRPMQAKLTLYSTEFTVRSSIIHYQNRYSAIEMVTISGAFIILHMKTYGLVLKLRTNSTEQQQAIIRSLQGHGVSLSNP